MAYKMKGHSLPGPNQRKPGTPKRGDKMKTYQATIDAVTPDMTDDQLRQMVLKQHAGKADKWNVSLNTLKKIRSGMQSETPAEPVEPPKESVEIPSTLQEYRDDVFEGVGDISQQKLSEERRAQLHKDLESGYQTKLRNAIVNKYGKELHELTGQDAIDAGNAMIDKEGNILPMSSAGSTFSERRPGK